MKIRAVVLAVTLVTGSLAPAVAAGSTEPESLSRYVLSHANDFLKQSLAPEQLASLHLAAYSAAAASACGDLDLDEAKFTKHFERLAHKAEARMSPEQKVYFERQLMLAYGVAIGAFLAEAGQSPDTFCDGAKAFKAESQANMLWK
jgi:hypothetical protein